jgi:Saxitoxin biosynthesis operon protein SxtJ
MININWHPSPRELRQWAFVIGPALAVVGALFYFAEWGIFSGGEGFAMFLWLFGAIAFLTGLTGTKLGMPAYWVWMAFVFVVNSVISFVLLTAVFFLVVTPLALIGRLFGRDRLQLRARECASYWCDIESQSRHDPKKQF